MMRLDSEYQSIDDDTLEVIEDADMADVGQDSWHDLDVLHNEPLGGHMQDSVEHRMEALKGVDAQFPETPVNSTLSPPSPSMSAKDPTAIIELFDKATSVAELGSLLKTAFMLMTMQWSEMKERLQQTEARLAAERAARLEQTRRADTAELEATELKEKLTSASQAPPLPQTAPPQSSTSGNPSAGQPAQTYAQAAARPLATRNPVLQTRIMAQRRDGNPFLFKPPIRPVMTYFGNVKATQIGPLKRWLLSAGAITRDMVLHLSFIGGRILEVACDSRLAARFRSHMADLGFRELHRYSPESNSLYAPAYAHLTATEKTKKNLCMLYRRWSGIVRNTNVGEVREYLKERLGQLRVSWAEAYPDSPDLEEHVDSLGGHKRTASGDSNMSTRSTKSGAPPDKKNKATVVVIDPDQGDKPMEEGELEHAGETSN